MVVHEVEVVKDVEDLSAGEADFDRARIQRTGLGGYQRQGHSRVQLKQVKYLDIKYL
jgi:hypothetical protein